MSRFSVQPQSLASRPKLQRYLLFCYVNPFASHTHDQAFISESRKRVLGSPVGKLVLLGKGEDRRYTSGHLAVADVLPRIASSCPCKGVRDS
jgi:hypothetical protein